MSKIINLDAKVIPSDCLVFKHSTRCPVSSIAAQAVRSYNFSLPLYWINVVEQRELSSWIAEQYHVKHESPQLLQIRSDLAVKVLNHSDIRSDNFIFD